MRVLILQMSGTCRNGYYYSIIDPINGETVLRITVENQLYAVRVCKHTIPGIPGIFEGGTELLTVRNKFKTPGELKRFFFWRGKKKRRRTYAIAKIEMVMI